MKTLLLTLILVPVSILLMAGNNISGDSNSVLDEYRIVQTGDKLYELSYTNSKATFTIEVCPENDRCCYLLRGDQIELMYQCNKMGFGLRKMPDAFKKMETSVYKQFLNSKSFQQQSLLSASKKSEMEALGLIACFFPYVLNEESYAAVFEIPGTEKKATLTSIQ